MKDKLFVEAEIKLYSYKRDKIELENLREELSLIESEYNWRSFPGIASPSFSEIKVKNNSYSPVENWLLSKDERYDNLLSKSVKLAAKINKIERAMKLLNEAERKIIEKRYFEPIAWNRVSAIVGYSESHCKALRVKAINKIKRAI